MKTKGIIFSGPMALANVEGRKTVTRRLVKPQPNQSEYEPEIFHVQYLQPKTESHEGKQKNHETGEWDTIKTTIKKGTFISAQVKKEWFNDKSPYGKVGDRFYQQETWDQFTYNEGSVTFKADVPYMKYPLWQPPMWLDMADSRFIAEIVDIRIERVQEITEEDAIKEGVADREAYRQLWNKLHAKPNPVREVKKIIGYITYPWSKEDFFDSYYVKNYSFDGRIYKGLPLEIIENPYVWRIEYKEINK